MAVQADGAVHIELSFFSLQETMCVKSMGALMAVLKLMAQSHVFAMKV